MSIYKKNGKRIVEGKRVLIAKEKKMMLRNFTQQKYLALEGNIGAGKSTLLALLAQHISIQPVYEPCDTWQNVNGENILDAFYKDGVRWAYTFQSYAFVSRIVAQEEAARKSAEHELQIAERSIYSDRYCFAQNCYDLGLMNNLEWSIYLRWFNLLGATHVQPPQGFIYIQVSPEVCYERLLKRNRSEEHAVSLDYIRKLHELHEAWLIHKKNILPVLRDIPVLVINGDKEFEDDPAHQQEILDKIILFCRKQLNMPEEKVKIFNKIV